jgi:cytochrome c-type biogenesis protein CcmF
MWIGGILISLAGFVILFDKRYRASPRKDEIEGAV